MSADAFIFHSSEADDPATLAPGWYIGHVHPGDDMTTDGAVGPYVTESHANCALATGDYLRRKPA